VPHVPVSFARHRSPRLAPRVGRRPVRPQGHRLVSRPLWESFDTWQLVINTATTIITFLMVFLIQRAQNKDSHAIHLKLNELVAAVRGASNRLINVESLSEDELKALHDYYCKLVEVARTEGKPTQSHTIEEAAGPKPAAANGVPGRGP
jgi:low affinity Fe/Cu permease